ncbi:MAG: hypothetical protein ACLFVP_05520 [Candidatus Bathyarchaeia archaeon]
MTYETEVTALREQIDGLDHEILDRIAELSQAFNSWKHETGPNECYLHLIHSDVEELALQYRLDVEVVVEIFREIAQLIDGEGG